MLWLAFVSFRADKCFIYLFCFFFCSFDSLLYDSFCLTLRKYCIELSYVTLLEWFKVKFDLFAESLSVFELFVDQDFLLLHNFLKYIIKSDAS